MGRIVDPHEQMSSDMDRASQKRANGRGLFLLAYILPAIGILLFVFWPQVTGERTFFKRDVLTIHLEMKWVQAEAMKEGRMPLLDPYRAGGQPHAGNPNTVALYPDNLLYLLATPFWALNAHFWLHTMLAPFLMYWLGREWGLSRRGAWSAGVFFACSGYFLSCLNLYNVIAVAALAPALAAASLRLAVTNRLAVWLTVAAGVWALLIVAGDPVTAAAALAMAGLIVIAKYGWKWSICGRMVAATFAGTLLALPLVTEFLRILSLSYRGHWGYSTEAATAGSWHPASVIEWFIPLAFGRPDFTFWGVAFSSGFQPLFYTFYPGVLAMAMVLLGSVAMTRREWSAWLLIGLGIFFALGNFNPVVTLLTQLPGASLLRLPTKLWLFVAVGASILAGRGFERGSSTGKGASRAVLLVLLLLTFLWVPLTAAPDTATSFIHNLMPEGSATKFAEHERLRWAGSLLLALQLGIFYWLIAKTARWVPNAAPAIMLAVHLATQLFFLWPLRETDEVSAYKERSPIADVVPEGARVVHGGDGQLFGERFVSPSDYPDISVRWMHRQTFHEFLPAAGIIAGRYFDFDLSPEGLDAFQTRIVAEVMRQLDDGQRLKMLEAAGVEWLLLDRELELRQGEHTRVELEERFPSAGGDVHAYRLLETAKGIQFVGDVQPSKHVNEAVARMLDDDFDPRQSAVLAGQQTPGDGLPGVATMIEESAERLEIDVDAQGAGALVIQRAHLPLYRARVDGESVPIHVANVHRMAVRLPAGKHRVEVWVDRNPFRVGAAVSLLTGVGLILWIGLSRRRQRGAFPGGPIDGTLSEPV